MKRLLLVFILSPVVLFGQMRRKDIVDSIKAEPTNIQNVSRLISNKPGTRVEYIDATDSGEYVTILVRVQVTEAMTDLPALPVSEIKTDDITADVVSAIAVPPLPRIIVADTINALSTLAIFELNTGAIYAVNPGIASEPPLPDIVTSEMVEPMTVAELKIEDIPAIADTMVVPPMPVEITSAALEPITVTDLRTGDIPIVNRDAMTVPQLPDIVTGDPLTLLAVNLLRIEASIAGKADTLIVPPPPDIVLETIDNLPLCAAIYLATVISPTGKMDTVADTTFDEKKMAVAEMHLSDEGYSLLEKLEGFSPKLYSLKDGGFTIGFGFFVPYGETSMWSKGVTLEEAERLIREKVPTYEDQVKQYINVPLTQTQFDALTLLAYNLGGFSKATSIVNDVNRQADFDKVQHDWMRFIHSRAPGVAKGLTRRRRDELGVKDESNYQPDRKMQVLKN